MKRISLICLALISLLPLAVAGADIHLQGADGVVITLAKPAQRVVSLAPDLAELLYDIGAGESLRGAVEYTDYPAAAKALPRVGDAFHVDVEKLVALKPDLVLAWAGGTPEPLIAKLRALKLPVLTLGTHELLDIASNMETLGLATPTRRNSPPTTFAPSWARCARAMPIRRRSRSSTRSPPSRSSPWVAARASASSWRSAEGATCLPTLPSWPRL